MSAKKKDAAKRTSAKKTTAKDVELTELTTDQAAYIGVPVEGPYKLDHYRY